MIYFGAEKTLRVVRWMLVWVSRMESSSVRVARTLAKGMPLIIMPRFPLKMSARGKISDSNSWRKENRLLEIAQPDDIWMIG
jgi:hypothetical protein